MDKEKPKPAITNKHIDKHIMRTIKGFLLLILISFILMIFLFKQKGEVTINIWSVITSFLTIAAISYLVGWGLEALSSAIPWLKWIDK